MASRSCLAVVGTGLALCLVSQSRADVTFSDSTFLPANWTVVSVIGGPGGQTAQQMANGGNTSGSPDPYWEVRTNTNSTVWTAHMNALFTYDPALGAVTSFDFAIDHRNISFFGQGMAFGIAILQGGTYYYSGSHISGAEADFNWHSFSAVNLTESDFQVFGGGAGAPDFDGAPMTIGLYTANQGGDTIQVGYDDYFVRVNVVPEPASVVAISMGMVALLRRAARRSSRSIPEPPNS